MPWNITPASVAIFSSWPGSETANYLPYLPATDSLGSPVATMIFMRDRTKKEVPGPDGGLIFVETATFNIQRSPLDVANTVVTKRGVIQRANGEKWVVEGDNRVTATGLRYKAECRRLS